MDLFVSSNEIRKEKLRTCASSEYIVHSLSKRGTGQENEVFI